VYINVRMGYRKTFPAVPISSTHSLRCQPTDGNSINYIIFFLGSMIRYLARASDNRISQTVRR